jgi:catechol 2,3-dioxygenase-like lactoylglutathione lyase family enzyme
VLSVKATFSGFSVNDLEQAKQFYSEILGLKLSDEKMGLNYELPGGGNVFIYQKGDHLAATFTILNFVVESIDEAVDYLSAKGVHFERYADMPGEQDQKGILRGQEANQGPDIAWFKDPAGNILSVLQDS